MQLLCAEELGLLARAADNPDGLVEIQVAGSGAIAHFPALVYATALQLAGYLEPIADAGPFARWRIKPGIAGQVREILAEHGGRRLSGQRPALPGWPGRP